MNRLKMSWYKPIINTALCLWIGIFTQSFFSQNSHDNYIKSKQKKTEFNPNQYQKLKQQSIRESSGSKNGSGTFNPERFSQKESRQGDHYDYDQESYQGEYSEFDASEYQGEYEDYSSTPTPTDYSEYYDNDYNEATYDDYEKPSKPKSETSRSKVPKINESNSNGGMSLMRVLLIALGATVIGVLVYYFFMRYNIDEKGAKVKSFEEMQPEEIPKSELERRLEEALSLNDFREAIRIYFIFIIKGLAEKKWITWERKKTNLGYLIEMRSRSQYKTFNAIVNVYEIAWYGNYAINESLFKQVEPQFQELLNDLND